MKGRVNNGQVNACTNFCLSLFCFSNILFVTSHCVTDSNRESVAMQLNKTIQIDFKGACAGWWDQSLLNEPLDNNRHGTELGSDDYYFYLAFENAVCKDYVTEKFFDAIKNDIVPVVFGGADYEHFAPPHSYVDIQKFENIEEAGKYLMHLIENPDKYMEYFWWKEYYNVIGTPLEKDQDRIPPDFPCALCSFMHKTQEEKVYHDLKGPWEGEAGCKGAIRGHYCNRKIDDWYRGRDFYEQVLRNRNVNKIVDLQTFV